MINMFFFQGFILDNPFDKTGVDSNAAYYLRTAFFRAGRESGGAFNPDGATFIGKLSKKRFLLLNCV